MSKTRRIRTKEFRNKNKRIEMKNARQERRQRLIEARRKKLGKESEKKAARRSRRRYVVLIGVLVVILIGSWYGFKIYSLNKLYHETVEERAKLENEKKRLEEELENVNNPEYIEQQAREQLKMVKPGEVMYILPQEESSSEVEEGNE